MIADLAAAFGVYVHVPFCSTLCPYCDFAVVVARPELHERYLDALIEEVRAQQWGAPAGSLFIGGGTPSFVEPVLLARTIASLREIVTVDEDAEITIEANPESISRAGLIELRAAGVNRISIGAQSMMDPILRALGRTHSSDDIARAVESARHADIENVSLDLIYGAPGETDEDWRTSLRDAIGLGADHISCYALTIEDRTPFGKAVARKAMRAPDEDVLADRYETARAMLAGAGFEHYEISNWARPGLESRHNLVYWTQGDYLGAGLGAHSHRDGSRWWNTRALKRYLDDPVRARDGEERLTDAQRAEEWLSLRLRLIEGIDLAEAARKLGQALATDELERDGLVRIEQGRMLLTERGMLLENQVALRLL